MTWVFAIAIALALASTAPVYGQSTEGDGCSYTTCALRVSGGSVLAGIEGRTVGSLGTLSSPDFAALMSTSDSALLYLNEAAVKYRRFSWLSWIDLALVGGGFIFGVSDQEEVAAGLFAGGLVGSIFSSRERRRALDQLQRSIWWYNAGLPGRPLERR